MNYYVGMDLGATKLKIGITDEKGNIKAQGSFPTQIHTDAEMLIQYFGGCILEIIEKSKLPKKHIVGAGIGAPGLVDPETGQLKFVTNMQVLNEHFLGSAIEEIIGIATFLDNDANAMALGELYFGAAKGYKNVIAMTLGTGVGGGLIFNGQIYRGSSYTAGELGHISIDSNGLLCNCGNYGCIERYIGIEGIVNRFESYRYKKQLESIIDSFLEDGTITPKSIVLAAKAGDVLSKEVIDEIGTFLGIALASLINILNPEIIVIGGGVSNAGEILFEPARREMRKRAYVIPAQTVKVVQAHLGNDAGIVGAASIAVDNLFRENRDIENGKRSNKKKNA